MKRDRAQDLIRTEPAPPRPELTPAADRYASLDIARGIIMIIMALDHASLAWNAGRPALCLEGAVGFPPVEYGNWLQQLTREVTHICAPGFQFLAGMGLAISVWRRERRGRSQWQISGDMLLRGLVLCFCEFVLLYYVYGQIPFFFAVLACIGCNIILFSVLRKLPLGAIAALCVAVILLAPFYAQDEAVTPSAASYPVNILFNITLAAPWRFCVMYPILPWIACFGLGWCFGVLYERGDLPQGNRLAAFGGTMIAAAFLLRWFGGGYADRLPIGDGPASAAFWKISKYPPSPVFLIATLGATAVMVGLLRPLDHSSRLSRAWKPAITYGRVALFFYVVHFFLYGTYPIATGTKSQYRLATTYAAWVAGLIVMILPCHFYHRLRTRYRRFLRYF